MSQTESAPQVTGKMFLFEDPQLLNKEQHSALGISKPSKVFGFCAKARAVPITIGELAAASRDFPIVFMAEDNPLPLAVTGVIDEVNLFVDDNGDWADNVYVPGYLRRYPFGVATDNDGDRMAIVIDRGFDGLVERGEQMLFDNDQPTQFTQQAVEFSKTYEQDRALTQRFAEEIKKYDLLSGQSAQYTPSNETEARPFAQYIGIDEQKLAALSDEQFLELRRSNVLPVIYAQLMSQGNWRALMMRRARRFNLTEDTIAEPRQLS